MKIKQDILLMTKMNTTFLFSNYLNISSKMILK